MDTYKTIIDDTTTQFTEKHSRFIGYVAHTETDEEAVAFIDKIRSIHSDARHNVYAYVLNQDNRMRYSDDGEPHGTAGKPILDIINGLELKDITVVVTRYFGGILLGTGGLVRAYSKAAKDTLDTADKYMMVPGITYEITCDYSQYARLEALIGDFNGNVENTLFEQNVSLIFSLSAQCSDKFIDALTDSFASSLYAVKIAEKYTKQKI
ncbi:MAG: YigZ family protein [Acutalibacteraceae bacterium]|nr:YigZ family protein [Acutalibacteraceae bacterium]